MTPYVDSRDGRSLSIYGSECQIWKLVLRYVRQSIQIRLSPKRGKCTWNSNLYAKCRTERRSHAFKFSDAYKSTMDWCSAYLTPQALSKYIYLSPLLIFPTTSAELGQQTARCESPRELLHYVEWDRIVTLAGSKSGLRVTLSYLVLYVWFPPSVIFIVRTAAHRKQFKSRHHALYWTSYYRRDFLL